MSRKRPAISSDALPAKRQHAPGSGGSGYGVSTRARTIVDKRTIRLTVPTSSGKQYPVLMGSGATSMLMYVASNPGCKSAEICAALDISYERFRIRSHRLKAMGLIIGNYHYQINTAVQLEMRLVRFLRALSDAYEMPSGPCSRLLKGERANVPIMAPLPDDLFGTPNRTRILLFIAVLRESYCYEMHHFIDIDQTSGPRRLADFLNEGVLRMRLVNHVKIYSLNPDYPGAEDLEVLLRRMAIHSPRICAAANAAHVRRYALAQTHVRERAVFADLEARASEAKHWSTAGVQRVIGKRAWRVTEGLSDYVVFRKGKYRSRTAR